MLRWPIRENVELRVPEERYAEELYAVIERNRERLERWLHWAHNTHSVEDVREYVRMARSDFLKPTTLHFLIFCDDRVSGGCGLILRELTKSGEIGYWIDQEHEGQGIVTDCCRALMRYAFEELQLNRVQIRCSVGNERSLAIPRRLGMTFEGRLRETIRTGDRLQDEECYSVLRSEWRKVLPFPPIR